MVFWAVVMLREMRDVCVVILTLIGVRCSTSKASSPVCIKSNIVHGLFSGSIYSKATFKAPACELLPVWYSLIGSLVPLF